MHNLLAKRPAGPAEFHPFTVREPRKPPEPDVTPRELIRILATNMGARKQG